MKEIVFANGIRLVIDVHVLNKMFSYCQTHGKNEAGGILLGKLSVDMKTYYVCDLSEPTKADKCGPLFFIRNKNTAQMRINHEWESSNGTVNYLGEWHTHSQIDPEPSLTDRLLVKQIVHDKSNKYPHVFMIIIGFDKSIYIGQSENELNGEIKHSMLIGGK